MEKDNQHSEIMRSLGRLEAGQEAIIKRQDVANHRTEKVENRVSVLEATSNQGIGKTTVISTISGAIFGVIGAIISGHYFK